MVPYVSGTKERTGQDGRLERQTWQGEIMLHLDFNWDLSPSGILLDEELNIDKLGWKDGDFFKVETVNGRRRLTKVDPLIAFVRAGAEEMKNEN